MKYIDFHCDTLMQAFLAGEDDICTLKNMMIDLERLKKADCMAQFFAIFMPPAGYVSETGCMIPDDETYIQSLFQIMENTVKRYPEQIAIARRGTDLKKNEQEGKISAFLTLEDGRAVNGSMETLEQFYNMGIRLISLTWNGENCFGYPNSNDPLIMDHGLTDFGKDAVVRMQELGMLVDVSHLSDGGFWDVVSLSKKPFVASHSNCRALSPHNRNLTDEMIRALSDRGGVIGLNFFSKFLSSNIESEVSLIQDMVRHIKYLVNCGGEECVALGTDLDGIRGNLEIGSADKIYLLFDALSSHGFSEGLIEKLAYGNGQRVIQDVL